MFDILKRKGRNDKTHKVDHSGGMRLVEAEVDIMFIVKNSNVIYINDSAEHLYSTDKDGDIKLDGRIVNFKFKDSNELIEIFVAFDKNDSYTMFTANIERDERLNYVAQSVFQFLGEDSGAKVFSPTSLYQTQYLYTFKLYKKNSSHFMINNTHSQAYLVENNLYKDTNPDEILSTFWSDEREKPVSGDGGDITIDPSGMSKELRFETFEQAAKWATQHSGRGITRSADGSCYIPKPRESDVTEIEMDNLISAEGISSLVEKRSDLALGGFLDMNNDLGSWVEENKDAAPGLFMPYLYARRVAAAGMFAQGIIESEDFLYVENLFFTFMVQVGNKISHPEQIKFQEDSFDSALALMEKYVFGISRESARSLIDAAKAGVSTRNALLSAFDANDEELAEIISPVMHQDWILKCQYCMGFFTTESWATGDDTELTSKKLLTYLKSTGVGIDIPMHTDEDWLDQSARRTAEMICQDKLLSRSIAHRFVLEELCGASMGNKESQEFAQNSGYPAAMYLGTLSQSSPEIDGPDGAQMFLLTESLQIPEQRRAEFRMKVTGHIMRHFQLGKYMQENDLINELLLELRNILDNSNAILRDLAPWAPENPEAPQLEHSVLRDRRLAKATELISAISEKTKESTEIILKRALSA